jgi:hypothetical protein
MHHLFLLAAVKTAGIVPQTRCGGILADDFSFFVSRYENVETRVRDDA